MFLSKIAESDLQIEGDFLGFTLNAEAKRKSIRLSVAEREIQLKLSKELRDVRTEEWMPGDRIQVLAKTKFQGKEARPQIKAYQLDRVSCMLPVTRNFQKSALEKSPQPNRGKILICQKSGCLKGSGKNLYSEIERALSELGLQDRIKIETTGCQKRCKKAPNMTLMPGNRRCSQMSSNSLYLVLKEHYQP